MTELPRMNRPCAVCPWRRDSPPGGFPSCNYDRLRDTSVAQDGGSVPLGSPLFGCHTGVEGDERACAGWLAVIGPDHVGVRYAVATGRLDPTALTPGEDWPPLFDSYEAMVAMVAAPDGASRWERGEGREGKLTGAGRTRGECDA